MNNNKDYNDFTTKRSLFARRPTCPFCGLPIEQPKELDIKRPGDMPVGVCSCGAVYACDTTGYNQGSALAEALVFGSNMDWDLAWNLVSGEDYIEDIVENYDLESHLIVPTGAYEGRKISGILYFLRMHKEIQEVTKEGIQKKIKRAEKTSTALTFPSTPVEKIEVKKLSRKEIEDLLREYRIKPILAAAEHNKKIMRELQKLLFTGEELLRLRTAETLGKASAVIAKKTPGTVANLLQRLFNSFSDPGTSGWGSIDAIAEIIGNSPDIYAGYIPSLYQFLEDDLLRPKVMRALGRIANIKAEFIQRPSFNFIPFLKDADPETRGYTAWLLGSLGANAAKDGLQRLVDDRSEINIYKNGELNKITVGQLAEEALKKI